MTTLAICRDRLAWRVGRIFCRIGLHNLTCRGQWCRGVIGTGTVRRHDNGRVEVVDVDPVVGISLELLAQAGPPGFPVDRAGRIRIAGDPRYLYRAVRFAAARDVDGLPAAMIVCKRVRTRPNYRIAITSNPVIRRLTALGGRRG